MIFGQMDLFYIYTVVFVIFRQFEAYSGTHWLWSVVSGQCVEPTQPSQPSVNIGRSSKMMKREDKSEDY